MDWLRTVYIALSTSTRLYIPDKKKGTTSVTDWPNTSSAKIVKLYSPGKRSRTLNSTKSVELPMYKVLC